jgi:hypothetical protein
MRLSGVSIDDRQRDPRASRLLRAYSAEYRRGKRYRGARHTVSALLAAAGPFASLSSLTAAGLVGAAASAWVIVTRVVLIPAEQRRVDSAVRIHERFDTLVFQLDWPRGLAGPEPSEEDIADAARRLADDTQLAAQIEAGWFPSTAGIPWPVDVLIAQLSSVTWGRRQHDAYSRFLIAMIAAAVLGIVGFAVVVGMSLTDWLITFLLPGMPALLDASELANAHRQSSSGKADLERRLSDLWATELATPGTTTGADCREVQDDAFVLRAAGLQIPEWYYRLYRGRSEANMQDAAAARRAQYEAATASPQNST